MGESKRKRGRSVPLEPFTEIEVFSPFDPKNQDDPVRWAALTAGYRRSFQRPTPVCGACDFEFPIGLAPALMYVLRPLFPPQRAVTLLSGFLCGECAQREDVAERIFAIIHKSNPHLRLVEPGRA